MKRIRQHYMPKVPHPLETYFLVDKRLLHVGDYIDFSLYIYSATEQIELYIQGDTIIDEELYKLVKLAKKLYAANFEKSLYEKFVEQHIQTILQNETLTIDEKTEVIYAAATEIVHTLYENSEGLKNVERTKAVITPVLESILYKDDIISSYIKVISYDYYTHTHSLNVSIYALCLGAELSLNKEQLLELGQAALLHDLGKSKIRSDIVNKESKLTLDEFEIMKMHPRHGYMIALDIGIKNAKILDGILHHHEKLNGEGYPDRLFGKRILLYARIISVCDIFDALTTRRSYKTALSSYDALYLMKIEMRHELDIDLIDVFIQMMHS